MNSYIFLKKTIISKKSLVLWLTILLEIYVILRYKNIFNGYNLPSIYENMLLLFKFSVIIIQYLLFISMYIGNYRRDYIILRYGNIKILKRLSMKDTIILTIFFVLMFNVIAIVLIKIMFNPILTLEAQKYMALTIIFQLFSFLFIGYLCVTVFFKNNSMTGMVISVLILYFILILIFQDTFSYLILPTDIEIYEIINMSKVMISIFIMSIIFSRRPLLPPRARRPSGAAAPRRPTPRGWSGSSRPWVRRGR